MRISLLLKREPFGQILENTLEAFFKDRFNHSCSISWVEAEDNRKHISTSDAQEWVCNPYLNVIFLPGTDNAILEPVLREFSYTTVAWRRPLQRLYCSLATDKYTAPWLSKIRVVISPPLPGSKELLIVGGNHRIRILDRRNGLSYVINKDGFSPEKITNEISFRQHFPGLPLPEIIEVAENGSWFSERYIAATPINRLSDQQYAIQILNKAIEVVKKLAEDTSRELPLADYSHALHKEIAEKITVNHLLSPMEKDQLYSRCAEIVNWLERINDSGSLSVSTSITHGDFQPANILADDDKVWLIDWEYTKKRQTAYDGLVFALNSRYSTGLSGRIAEIIANPDNSILKDWPHLNWQDPSGRQRALALFLLEELELYLSENDNQLFSKLSGGVLQFMDELASCVNLL